MMENVKDLLRQLEERLAKVDRVELMKLLVARTKHHHSYSFNNTFLAGLQLARQQEKNFDIDTFTNLWLAPRSVWENWGYTVKKDARALDILVPYTTSIRNSTESGATVASDNYKRIKGFGVKPIFDVSQTEKKDDNDNAPHRHTDLSTARISYVDLVNRLEAGGFRIISKPLREDVGGYIEENIITVNSNNSQSARFATILHELGHSLLSHTKVKKRLDRSIEELEAEAVAFVLGHKLGIEIPSEFYICSWGGDGKKIRRSLSKIDRAAREAEKIIGSTDTRSERMAA